MRSQRTARDGTGHIDVDAVEQHACRDQRHDTVQHLRFLGAVHAFNDRVDRLLPRGRLHP